MKVKVKSLEKLFEYFAVQNFRVHPSGVQSKNGHLCRCDMLKQAGTEIDVTPIDSGTYDYFDGEWYWFKDWLDISDEHEDLKARVKELEETLRKVKEQINV